MPRPIQRALRALGYVRRFLFNPRIRSENITRAIYGNTLVQSATHSEPDRYPELFSACKLYLADLPAPTVLSFGCSTGDEAFSLAEYLTHADIIGVDINRWCLTRARKANHNIRIKFLHSRSRQFAKLANFDAVFCMAVLQRMENRISTAPVAQGGFTFAEFERTIRFLDSKLAPGGLFFIDHTDFRFEDTDISSHYTPLLARVAASRTTALFSAQTIGWSPRGTS